MKNAVIFLSLIFVLSSCLDTKREVKDEKSKSSNVMITQADIKAALDSIKKLYPEADLQRAEKGLGAQGQTRAGGLPPLPSLLEGPHRHALGPSCTRRG